MGDHIAITDAVGMIDKAKEMEFGKWSSISSRDRYNHLHANIFGRCMNPSIIPQVWVNYVWVNVVV